MRMRIIQRNLSKHAGGNEPVQIYIRIRIDSLRRGRFLCWRDRGALATAAAGWARDFHGELRNLPRRRRTRYANAGRSRLRSADAEFHGLFFRDTRSRCRLVIDHT